MSPALRRLTLGTWGANTLTKNMNYPALQSMFKNMNDLRGNNENSNHSNHNS